MSVNPETTSYFQQLLSGFVKHDFIWPPQGAIVLSIFFCVCVVILRSHKEDFLTSSSCEVELLFRCVLLLWNICRTLLWLWGSDSCSKQTTEIIYKDRPFKNSQFIWQSSYYWPFCFKARHTGKTILFSCTGQFSDFGLFCFYNLILD